MSRPRSLPILNLDTVNFECVYPTCKGACCKESRPTVEKHELANIKKHLKRFLPLMRPKAQAIAEKGGFRTNRIKAGLPTLAVVDRYCIFWNDGCVLHKQGATEGNKNKYKPLTCIAFPIEQTDDGNSWYVRQTGLFDDNWGIDCLDPKATKKKARASLKDEVGYLESQKVLHHDPKAAAAHEASLKKKSSRA